MFTVSCVGTFIRKIYQVSFIIILYAQPVYSMGSHNVYCSRLYLQLENIGLKMA
jgi:hypothetical protein